MQAYLRERIDLVKALAESRELPVKYADLGLITCAVMSACAAWRWPGRRIDRGRFVELLARHSHDGFRASWVSVPALLNEGLITEEQTPYARPGNHLRIYTDDEIDLSMTDAEQAFPGIEKRRLRSQSYACLIYEQLRCGYSHNYFADRDITAFPPSDDHARVSYIGRVSSVLRTGRGPGLQRMIYFHLEYLIELAEHHVAILPGGAESAPAEWWIDAPQSPRGPPTSHSDAFDYTADVLREIDAFFRKTGKIIVALTVREILDEQLAKKLA